MSSNDNTQDVSHAYISSSDIDLQRILIAGGSETRGSDTAI